MRSLSVSLSSKRKAGNTKLVFLFLFTLLLCLGNSYTYAQTDSAVLDYKNDTTHLFTLTKSGKVGIGTGTPTAQLHTLGTVRFQKFRNNTYEDSVLTTDVNGNLKFVHKWAGQTAQNGEANFYNANEANWHSKMWWNEGSLGIIAYDNSRNATHSIYVAPDEGQFDLRSIDGNDNSSVEVSGAAGYGNSLLRLSASKGSKGRAVSIAPDNITLEGIYNNAAGDS
ncbi:MAG TPA: hypothetical protein VIM79_19370, partial [Niastella sp.]